MNVLPGNWLQERPFAVHVDSILLKDNFSFSRFPFNWTVNVTLYWWQPILMRSSPVFYLKYFLKGNTTIILVFLLYKYFPSQLQQIIRRLTSKTHEKTRHLERKKRKSLNIFCRKLNISNRLKETFRILLEKFLCRI